VALAVGLLVLTCVVGTVGAPSLGGEFGSEMAPSHSEPHSGLQSAAPSSIIVNLVVSPQQVTEGTSIQVTTSASGGHSPPSYSYTYFGLPSGCTGFTQSQFQCDPSQTGTFNDIYVSVTDGFGNTTMSNTVSLDVTSSSGNGNGNGGNGDNNSSNPFGSLLSGLGGFLSILLIFGIVGFVTWILLVVGVWIIAIVLLRRLPKRGGWPGASPMAATMKCASCSASIPTDTKFCPECGAGTAVKT
jgi:hypothetical protein